MPRGKATTETAELTETIRAIRRPGCGAGRFIDREAGMTEKNSQGWEFRDPGAVFCVIGVRRLLTRGAPEPPGDIGFWAAPANLFGLVLGLANAYLLGVWRSVSREALWEFAPLLLIAGLIGGVMAVRRRRAQAQLGGGRSPDRAAADEQT